ncbi:MAG: ABC transporter ATP-binding protein [Planctomycetota bacterium]
MSESAHNDFGNSQSPVIQFLSVTKSYRRTVAVDDVSYEVPPGVVFALLGDNGAGKTTSIGAMLGTIRVDSGTVRVLGQDPIRDSVQLRHRIGIVPEQPSLYDWMTVDQTGWFAAGFHEDGFQTNFRESIKRFGVPPGAKIRQLSKGMKAKVSLSLATAHEPELLILDEPTSGLDPMVRREFLESMIERAATGQTVFLSSHQINEVERVADHVALMRQGKLVHCGRLEDIKASTRELQINVTDVGVPAPPIGDNLISATRTGRQWRLLVRDLTDDQREGIQNHPFVDRFVVHEPSLEEIFVGYVGSQNGSSANGVSVERGSTNSGSENASRLPGNSDNVGSVTSGQNEVAS